MLNIPVLDRCIFYIQCIIEDLLWNMTSKFHMVRFSLKDSRFAYDFFLYSTDKSENELPRLLVIGNGRKAKPVRIEISEEAKIIFPCHKKILKSFNYISEAQKFVQDNYWALMLHWDGDWDDEAICSYVVNITRKKRTPKEALIQMLNSESIYEIPKNVKYLFGKTEIEI